MTCAVYDLTDCTTPEPEPADLLDAMRTAATRLGATVLGELPVLFQPHGITCVLVLAESHLIVSTWPEHKLAHIDLFTCRADTVPEHALEPVINALGGAKVHAQCIQRVTPAPDGVGKLGVELSEEDATALAQGIIQDGR